MKKYLSFMMAIVLVCAMASCSRTINEDLSVANPETRTEKFIWERELYYIMEHNTVVKDYPLKLLGYKHIGAITNESDIDSYLKEIYSDDAYIAVSAPNSELKFEIFQYRDIVNGERDFDVATIFQKQQAYLRERAVLVGMQIVELNWEYKGKKFTSLTLATNDDEGIVYDNIVTYAPSPRPNGEHPSWEKYLKKPNKTITDTQTRVIENDSIAYSDFFKHDYSFLTTNSGKHFWYYKIECVSKFRKIDGIYTGVDVMRAYFESKFPYDCKAEIKEISGEPYSSMSHRFAWAYIYGMGSVSISYTGSGFTISGGSNGENGVEVHTIDTCSSAGM